MVTIPTLSSITLDKLLARGNPFIKSECRFDLKDIHLITPGALVPIAASCYALAQKGRSATIAVPESPVRTYLSRSGFVNTVSEVAKFEPPFKEVPVRLRVPARFKPNVSRTDQDFDRIGLALPAG